MSEQIELAKVSLTDTLKLHTVGLKVTGARIVGRGGSASADLYLSDGSAITFERFATVGKPQALMVEVAATTGATPQLKQVDALGVMSWMHTLAEHVETVSNDDVALDWGVSFLAVAEPIDVDMSDQAERWGAFQLLEDHDPYSIARSGGCSIAKVSRVLVGVDGRKYVRTGWFRAHVRIEDGTVSPAEIANRMQRIGWHRPGTKGQIKATRPGLPGVLLQSFYIVPADWPNEPGNPVTPGNPLTRTRTPARKEHLPRVTGLPEEALA